MFAKYSRGAAWGARSGTQSVVIDDLHVEGIALVPDKTDPPLVINANAVLTGTLPVKRFEAVGRRDAEVIQDSGIIEHTQFAPSHLLDIPR